MKTETALRFHLISVRMTAIAKERATHAEEKMEKVTSIHGQSPEDSVPCHRDACMSLLIAAPIMIPRRLNQSRSSSAGGWLIKMWYICTTGRHSIGGKIIHRKMDESENHIKQDSPDSERQVLCIFCHMWTLTFNVSCVCMYFQMCVCTCNFFACLCI